MSGTLLKFYLGGQNNFGNRGCEALVRGISNLIRERLPNAEILCPLQNIEQDSQQWPFAKRAGVSFVPAPSFPGSLRWWSRLNRILPLEGNGIPRFSVDNAIRSRLRACSALITTGGDNLTLDYSIGSLYFVGRLNEVAFDMGLPALLWAASVGPFSAKPAVEKVMIRHLRRYTAITVRETVTFDYLRELGIDDVELVADPAFVLEPEAFDVLPFTFNGDRPLLGFNVSPLIRKFRRGYVDASQMDREIEHFLRTVAKDTNLSILLVPHVAPCDGSAENSDWHYMEQIYRGLGRLHDRIVLVPPNLNAAQLKYLIGKCRFFIGARTHATIASLSQGVPTLSIAYSAKAMGLNKDLFGHLRYVLKTPNVSEHTLMSGLATLQNEESDIKDVLRERLPDWRMRARRAADVLLRVICNERIRLAS